MNEAENNGSLSVNADDGPLIFN